MMGKLDGRRLLLTRSADDAADWVGRIEAEGARTVVLPCITTISADDALLAERLQGALTNADWLVFTSRRGVDATAALPFAQPDLAATRIATVGQVTAESARAAFGRVDLVGQKTAATLAAELAASIKPGTRCVLALAANADNTLERALTKAGASVLRFNVYRTVPAAAGVTKRRLSTLDCDTVIFASPSAVTGFDNQVEVDAATRIVTIGPSTSAAVRERDWTVTGEAKEPSLSSIIELLAESADV